MGSKDSAKLAVKSAFPDSQGSAMDNLDTNLGICRR